MKYAKHIPNMISVFRLIFCFSLLFLTQLSNRFAMRMTFTVAYCLVGFTDVLDGWIARKFGFQSELGAKLDNIADTCMFCVGFVCLIFLLDLQFFPSFLHCIIPLGLAVALKVFSFALTKLRFGQWNTMHTYFNKALGCVLFLCVPLCLWLDSIHYAAAIGVAVLIALTVAEDTYILLTRDYYDSNCKGLLFEKRKPALPAQPPSREEVLHDR